MSTIRYILRSKSNKPVSIYASISVKRGLKFREKTGFDIHPSNWSEDKSMPKESDANLKYLRSKLKDLEAHLYRQLNRAQAEGILIDKDFIQTSIAGCFNRPNNDDVNYFIFQVQKFIDSAPTKKVKGKSAIGLSDNSIKNWKAFKSKFERFEKFRRAKVTLDKVDLNLIDEFKNWSFGEEAYSVNTVGKDLSFIRQIVDQADRLGVRVSTQARLIESFAEPDEDRLIVTLSFEELDRIERHQLDDEGLDQVRLWLLIGCEMGQRGVDLLNIDFCTVRKVQGQELIDVFQTKTGKWVTVPITPRCKSYLRLGTPEKIRLDQFNDGLKTLLAEVKISEMIEGKKRVVLEEGKTRTVFGKYPKHELMTTHSCRRSFATNYYKKMPTPVLMDITGHVKESTFLKYIGKPKDKDDNALLFLRYLERES